MLLQNTVHIYVRIRTLSKCVYNQQSIPLKNMKKNQNLSCERQGGEALQKQSAKFDIFFWVRDYPLPHKEVCRTPSYIFMCP
jgi:hypothetical protein